jgi:excisionase family DNA binding protein
MEPVVTRLMKPPQVAKQTGLSYAAVLGLIHSKELPVVKLPGRRGYLVDERDVVALIERFRTVQPAEKVDQFFDQLNPKQRTQTVENRVVKKVVKKGEFIINPNWCK